MRYSPLTLLPIFASFVAVSWNATTIAQSVGPVTKQYQTIGNPTSALAMPDGKFLFVSVTNVNAPNFTGPDAAAGTRPNVISGIQVFRSSHGELSPLNFVRTGSTGANGLVLLPGAKTLVVGVGDAGVAFLDVDAILRGDAVPVFADQGPTAGTFDIVASRDGRYIFSANEYGVIDGQRGNVGITATGIDSYGHIHHPSAVGHIPLGDVVPSLNISPDGSRLYVATELLPADQTVAVAGKNNPVLAKSDCVQRKGTAPKSGGFLSVIDVERAIRPDAKDAILAMIASGCSPVRIVESRDASALFVSARGDNVILEFDPAKLTADPEHAFRRSITTGGTAPVGLHLFDHDRQLAVANSNRFDDAPGTLALIDLRAGNAHSEILRAGQFPRNLSSSHDDAALYLTNYASRSVESISFEYSNAR